MKKKTMRDIVIDFLDDIKLSGTRKQIEEMSDEELLDQYYIEREYQMNAD